MVGTVEQFVDAMKRKNQPVQSVPVDDVPLSEYELGAFGRYERVRIDLPISEPGTYTQIAEKLEQLAQDFRGAARARLPAPTDVDYRRERLFLMLNLQRRVNGVRKQVTELWKKARLNRGS